MGQPFIRAIATSVLAVATLATTACKDDDVAANNAIDQCAQCGVIRSVEPRKVKGEVKPASVIAGAIVGGVIGHQFGSGSGNDAATAAGAIGGAVAGSEVDRNRRATTVYEVVVAMDDGGTRDLTLNAMNGLTPGERVRVDGHNLIPL